MNHSTIEVTEVKSASNRNYPVIKTFDEFLQDNMKQHKGTIDKIRKSNDKAYIDSLKRILPACQFCTTDGHGIDGIKKTSNVMQIDIDAKDNPDIKNLKEAVSKIPYIFYAMYSASGNGLFTLVEIADFKLFKQHFEAFKTYAKAAHNIVVDSAVSSPASLRFWSCDEAPIINSNSQKWNYIPKPIIAESSKAYLLRRGAENNPFDDFNKNADIERLLIAHNWTYQPQYDKGTRKRYSRPGKLKGISADWCTERRILYVFSNAAETQLQDAGKGYNAVAMFCCFECSNDMKLCAAKLKAMGYGR